jgi:hypothetical protein
VSTHPLVTIVSPRPVSTDPDVIGRRAGSNDLLLRGRRCLGYNDCALGTRNGRSIDGGGLPGRCDHGSARRRSGYDVRFGFGRAATQRGSHAAERERRCEQRAQRSGIRGESFCFHNSRPDLQIDRVFFSKSPTVLRPPIQPISFSDQPGPHIACCRLCFRSDFK